MCAISSDFQVWNMPIAHQMLIVVDFFLMKINEFYEQTTQ